MKLLLTSDGLKNQTLVQEFLRLVGKPAKEVKLVYIPTAANVEEGDKGWLIDNLVELKELVGEVDIVDIAALPKEKYQPRLECSDVIVVGGGSSSYLYNQIVKSGLEKELPKLLETRIYMGISAGSMVLGPDISDELSQKYFNEILGGGLAFVKFWIKPHYNSPHFVDRTKDKMTAIFSDAPEHVYVLGDGSGVVCESGNTKVVGEGEWLEFGK